VLALLLGVAGLYLATQWFRRLPVHSRGRITLSVVGLSLLFLAMIGRLPWVLALAGGLLSAGVLLLGARHRHGDEERPDDDVTVGQSTVETGYLRMTLDHETGDMAGEVLAGRFVGSVLEALTLDQLLELLHDLATTDDESAALLRAYLDRSYGDEWQEVADSKTANERSFDEMTLSDAYAILGLDEGASREQIVAAHGRLIQRLHPDRGGSTFLAAKINQARDMLLGR